MVFPVLILVFDFEEFSEGVLHGHLFICLPFNVCNQSQSVVATVRGNFKETAHQSKSAEYANAPLVNL
jgi:hypothetical protein